MIPMIQQAITMGYTAYQILNFISKKFKSASVGINNARQQGYSDDDILKFLGGKIKPKNKVKADKQLSEQEQYLKSVGIKSKEEKEETKNKFISGALGAGITALGAYNIYQNYGGMFGSPQQPSTPTNPPIPGSPINPPDALQQTPGQMAAPQTPMPGPQIGQAIEQGVEQPIQQSMQQTAPAELAQAAQAMPQAQPSTQLPSIFEQLTKNVNVQALSPEKVKQLQFVKTISDKLEQEGKQITDPAFQGIAKKIKGILQGKPGTVIEETARIAGVVPIDKMKQDKSEITSVDPSPIPKSKDVQKGDTVVTEDGNVAEVKSVSGNNFLIEEDGKVKQVPMESLRSQPEAIKKAKIVFDPSKIPEDDRSAALAISIPMPDRSGIINMFHDGSFYLYKRKDGQPLEEDLIRRVIDGQDIPITSGDTFMGAWNNEKGDSRGSASFKELVAMAQDSTKEDDPSKPLMFTKITDSFTHGYMKEFQRLLKETTRLYSAKPKKEKKKSK